MITMDFKGVTWVGDIYQKFEAMCLEVEEAMYQDTVKYVENQVQTVGASVKKFYSDVVQDFLPPCSIDSVKVVDADLSLNPYTDFGIYKKSKTSIKEDPTKAAKQVAKDSKRIAGANMDHSSFACEVHNNSHFPPRSSVGSIEGAMMELCSEQNEDSGNFECSNVAIKRRSKRNNHPSSAILRLTTPRSKDLSRASLFHEINDDHEAICDQVVMAPCSVSVEITRGDSRDGKSCNNSNISAMSTLDASLDIQTSDTLQTVESCVKKETQLRNTYSNGTCTSSEEVSPTQSYAKGDAPYSESATEDGLPCTGNSGDCNLDLIEHDDIVEVGIDAIEQFENSKLEETGVLVDGSKLWPILNKEDKPRSYKKKIQKALSSKRSSRRQEYEQLAVKYGDMEAGQNCKGVESLMGTCTLDTDAQTLPTHNLCESEWELL